MQDQIVQQERLSALGQMAAGIAHDFNNLLTPLLGYTELFLNDPSALSDPVETREILETMNSAAKDGRDLVIDDEPSVHKLVTRYLKADGHTVDTAENGPEGLARLRSQRFDLVITDRAMPGMSGDQVAAAVKTDSPETAVILLTGFGQIMTDQGEKPEGVDLILGKPITRDELRHAIASIVH